MIKIRFWKKGKKEQKEEKPEKEDNEELEKTLMKIKEGKDMLWDYFLKHKDEVISRRATLLVVAPLEGEELGEPIIIEVKRGIGKDKKGNRYRVRTRRIFSPLSSGYDVRRGGKKYVVLGVVKKAKFYGVIKNRLRKKWVYTIHTPYDDYFSKKGIWRLGFLLLHEWEEEARKVAKADSPYADKIPPNINLIIALVEHTPAVSAFKEEVMEKYAKYLGTLVALNGGLALMDEGSPMGAIGLFQILPSTYSALRKKYPHCRNATDERISLGKNGSIVAFFHHIDVLKTLEMNLRRYGLDPSDYLYSSPEQTTLALAMAYNGGVKAPLHHMRKYGKKWHERLEKRKPKYARWLYTYFRRHPWKLRRVEHLYYALRALVAFDKFVAEVLSERTDTDTSDLPVPSEDSLVEYHPSSSSFRFAYVRRNSKGELVYRIILNKRMKVQELKKRVERWLKRLGIKYGEIKITNKNGVPYSSSSYVSGKVYAVVGKGRVIKEPRIKYIGRSKDGAKVYRVEHYNGSLWRLKRWAKNRFRGKTVKITDIRGKEFKKTPSWEKEKVYIKVYG